MLTHEGANDDAAQIAACEMEFANPRLRLPEERIRQVVRRQEKRQV